MGGWAKVIAILLAVGLGGYRYYDHGSFSARVSSSASETTAAAAQATQPAPQAQQAAASPDTAYLQSYVMRIQQTDRSFPYGTTVQNISLPSGKSAQLTIQKTKTGWCPIRHEDLYSVSIGMTMH